ncbi:T9SS type A sorting domain-containing protein, partial [candidate division KSB1 bacterium]
LIFCSIYSISFSQVIPNNSFENWTSDQPDSWDTSNDYILGTNIITVTPDTSSFDGSYAIKIKTTKYIILTVSVTFPGLITLGDLIINYIGPVVKIEGGIPFPARPDSLTGYYKASPAAGDSAMIVIGFSKYNSSTGRDTIGYAYRYIAGVDKGWTPFSLPIVWNSSSDPDSMNIIITSSDTYNMNLVNGSTIWIDKLSLIYSSASIVDMDFNQNIMVYPDNSGQKLIVHFKEESNKNTLIRFYNMTGQLLYENVLTIPVKDQYIDTSHLSKGTYIVEVLTGDDERFTQKIIIH